MKYENAFRVNNGVNNPAALVDKYIYGYRFMGFSLRSWRRMGLHAAIVTVLAGAAGAGLTLWFELAAEQLLWYGVVGGSAMVLLGGTAFLTSTRYHEQVMYTNISDYLENTLSCRLKNECEAEAEVKAERRRQQAKQRLETEETQAQVLDQTDTGFSEAEPELQVAAAVAEPKKTKRRFRKKTKAAGDEIEQMKKSLDQIAADTTENHTPPRSLTKEEQQAIVEDILREYLS